MTRIAHYLKYSDLEHIVQSEMALIGNMGRTIEDKTLRKEIMRDYDQLLQDMKAIGRSFASYAILSEHRDGLSRLRKNVRRKEGNHLIICISRTYGCGASQIAMDLAESLRLNYYNAEIFKTVLARLEADQDGLQDEKFYMPHDGGAKAAGPAVPFEGEKRSLKDMIRKSYRYHGLSVRDAVFFNQSNLILELAKKESFVIVGRCADAILENNDIPHISIYITAPFEQRVHRIMSINHLSEKAAAKQIREVDKGHEKYYKYYTGRRWARASNYDLCFNSSTYGVDGSVNFILNVLKSNGVIVDTDIVSHPVPDIEPSAEQLAATEANEKMIQGE